MNELFNQNMMPFIIIIAIVLLAFGAMVFAFGARSSKLNEELEKLENEHQDALGKFRQQQAALARLEAQNAQLAAANADLDSKHKQVMGHLDTADKDVVHYKAQAKERYALDRKIYRILTIGRKATGKTSLTLKWSNPLIELNTIEGTKSERYERTVSLQRRPESLVEHVFEVRDWGGEHIVDAQAELVVDEIHGILLVVDLGGKDARQVDQSRIQDQLNEFNASALRFFFGTQSMASCKTVVLFINKSDLIPGSPSQAEAQAKAYFAPLIEALQRYSATIDVKVMVGSASFGHSTHILFSHFVRLLLPKAAYDPQLLQRINEEPPRRAPTLLPGTNGVQAGAAQEIARALAQSNGQAHATPPEPHVQTPHAAAPRPPKPNGAIPRAPVMYDEPHSMEQTMPLLNRKPPLPQR